MNECLPILNKPIFLSTLMGSEGKIYNFALGVKSCWLVIPATETITIYSKPNNFTSFSVTDAEAIDEVMDIRLPIRQIFEW